MPIGMDIGIKYGKVPGTQCWHIPICKYIRLWKCVMQKDVLDKLLKPFLVGISCTLYKPLATKQGVDSWRH